MGGNNINCIMLPLHPENDILDTVDTLKAVGYEFNELLPLSSLNS